jgi:hypothetical protein
MKFRTWIQTEISLNGNFPEVLPPVNRGISTPASAEVVRTGLQPQVGAEEIETDAKNEMDKVQALDADIQRLDASLSQGESGEKINQFKKIWSELKDKWDKIKLAEKPDPNQIPVDSFGTQDHKDYLKSMSEKPNDLPVVSSQAPTGPSFQ